jgi:site-specific DNA recombinase
VKKMKVGYVRVSSEEQREKKTIETQRIELQKACEARGVKLEKIYEDDGVSGTIPLGKRPSGSALLQDAVAGRIEEIYIWKFDRLGRNLRDFLNLHHKLDKLGVYVESTTQPVPKGPAGRMMMQMLGAFAELDRENILENTRRGLAGKAARGGWTGGLPPFGYRKEGEKGAAVLVVDEEAVPGLKVSRAALGLRLFQDCASGKSCQVLADYLNALSVPTSRQNPGSIWRPNSVRVIITNPIYAGTRQWGRRQWVKVEDDAGNETVHLKMTPERVITTPCPPIVDEDLWQRANAALRENQITAMSHPKTPYLLRGLITCGICGLKFTGRGTHYACIGRHCAKRLYGKTRPPCPAPTVSRAELDAAVWGDIDVFRAKPGSVRRELKQQIAAQHGKGRQVSDDIAELEASLAMKVMARQIGLRQLTRQRITEADYDKEIESIDRETDAIEKRLTELRKLSATDDANAIALGKAYSALEELPRGELTFEQRRRAVEALVEVTVMPVEGRKEPSICIRYVFEPHHERYGKQWEQAVTPLRRNAKSYVPA